MTTQQISLLVTDLDNTLYDWVTYFATSFYEMVDVAQATMGMERDRLLDDLREVHQQFHNSEHPFALLEARCVKEHYSSLTGRQIKERLQAAFSQFKAARDRTLKLYPGVEATLERLRTTGVTIVGHTEATVPVALHRLKKLHILGYFSKLYAVRPLGDSRPEEERNSKLFEGAPPIRYLDQEERKPDPRVLRDICADQQVQAGQALYVGDSLSRDIGMAKEAGVPCAWAKYGTVYDKTRWEQLVRITHWTAKDVERADTARERYRGVKPDAVLENGFAEVMDQFDFQGAKGE
jgi:FMN phosphatase YigB (HAD superfamily)